MKTRFVLMGDGNVRIQRRFMFFFWRYLHEYRHRSVIKYVWDVDTIREWETGSIRPATFFSVKEAQECLDAEAKNNERLRSQEMIIKVIT